MLLQITLYQSVSKREIISSNNIH